MCYICEEKKFPGDKCNGDILRSVQQVNNDGEIQTQQKVQNQDHALQPPFHKFDVCISSYNNQNTPQTGLHTLLGEDQIVQTLTLQFMAKTKGSTIRIPTDNFDEVSSSQLQQLQAKNSFPTFCHLQYICHPHTAFFQVYKDFSHG